MPDRHILATSGGFESTGRGPYQWRMGGLLRHALSLSGKDRPRLCFVTTAGGDNDAVLRAGYAATSGESVEASHVALFPMPNVPDIHDHLLAQDVIWVGGGSVANLLALWRLHGVDTAMHAAWEAGVVLAGVSAGSVCWHVGGCTDSFGPDLQPVTNGLGFLPYGNGVHYDGELQRRPVMHRLVGDGILPLSYATDDGAGLHYSGADGTELIEAVAERPTARAWCLEPDGAGGVTERPLETRLLPDSRR